jgi:hypothetical protein
MRSKANNSRLIMSICEVSNGGSINNASYIYDIFMDINTCAGESPINGVLHDRPEKIAQ